MIVPDELYYVTYDPDAIWDEMMLAYIVEGGDLLYGGDEKEILLRAVLSITMHVFAGVDNALRMATLRYAQGEYLKLLGENRYCIYQDAVAATGTVSITFKADGVPTTIAAGEIMTPDGIKYFETTEAVTHTGQAETLSVPIRCGELGTTGNGVPVDTVMQFVASIPCVEQAVVSAQTSGGVEAEDMEAYRERIRLSGMQQSTTGPSSQYESATMAVSPTIIDATAVNGGAGIVNVTLLLSDAADEAQVIEAVVTALNDESVRPLTDTVNVAVAGVKTYTIDVEYTIASPLKQAEGLQQLRAAADEYLAWQDRKLGRAFDPYRLMSMLYQAGASRVTFGAGSTFGGGALVYTEVDPGIHTSGTITFTPLEG